MNGEIRDTGVLADAQRLPVYRFFIKGIHFHTTSEAERDAVSRNAYAIGVPTKRSRTSHPSRIRSPAAGAIATKE